MDIRNKIFEFFNIDPKQHGVIEIPYAGRDDFAKLLVYLNYDYGAEIGVEQGEYSETLLKANPNLVLYSIDAWRVYDGYRDHKNQEKLNKFFDTTQTRLAKYRTSTIMRNFSSDALKYFVDNSMDFVYIDANHSFFEVVYDIHNWGKKVHKDGLVAGHDYIDLPHIKVIPAVHGYMQSYGIEDLFIIGRENPNKGEKRDESRSWFFIKK